MELPASTTGEDGRFLGVLNPELKREFIERAPEILARRLVPAASINSSGDFMENSRGTCVHFERLGLVLIEGGLKGAGRKYFTQLESERVRRAPTPPVGSATETNGSAVNRNDTSTASWGIVATAADKSTKTGKNIKVAILDSGLDFNHEAFRGRAQNFQRRSFVSTPVELDEIGHGTACASIICGQTVPATGQQIGVAPGVDLVVAKIFDVQKQSPDTRTLAALDWAVSQGCSIVSMSIGDQLLPGSGFSAVFEAAAMAAFQQNVLLVAGAGNDSRRSLARFEPVSHPANCPSIMSVAALDRSLQVADFSNQSRNPAGGEMNLAAPGRSIRVAAAHAVLQRYVLKQGTSLAVPFVAGIAALWMESEKGLAGKPLWNKLIAKARSLAPIPGVDVGKGLVQAP